MVKITCKICSDELKVGFMDKIIGTQVTVKDGEKKHVYHVCSSCQKEKGAGLIEALS